jgi:hypothetical protein
LVPLILKLWAGPSVLLALIEFNLLPRCLSQLLIILATDKWWKLAGRADEDLLFCFA